MPCPLDAVQTSELFIDRSLASPVAGGALERLGRFPCQDGDGYLGDTVDRGLPNDHSHQFRRWERETRQNWRGRSKLQETPQ